MEIIKENFLTREDVQSLLQKRKESLPKIDPVIRNRRYKKMLEVRSINLLIFKIISFAQIKIYYFSLWKKMTIFQRSLSE